MFPKHDPTTARYSTHVCPHSNAEDCSLFSQPWSFMPTVLPTFQLLYAPEKKAELSLKGGARDGNGGCRKSFRSVMTIIQETRNAASPKQISTTVATRRTTSTMTATMMRTTSTNLDALYENWKNRCRQPLLSSIHTSIVYLAREELSLLLLLLLFLRHQPFI